MSKTPHAHIAEVHLTNSQVLRFGPKDKVLIVGANNSGKSQFLRELETSSLGPTSKKNLIVTDCFIDKNMNPNELRDYLDNNASMNGVFYSINDASLHPGHLFSWGRDRKLNDCHAMFIKRIDADARLEICKPQHSIPAGVQKNKPQHVLYDDSRLLEKISSLFYSAFRKRLLIDFRGGSVIPIHVGEVKDIGPDRVSDDYVNAISKNPLLHLQGDGIKSFAGILFEVVVSDRSITLVDEPEAFLHPPQMQKLGKILAEEVSGQLFVATHSSDILRGFLNTFSENIRILRISRDGENTIVFEGSSGTIRKFWDRPELRYSNALDGIFHEQTLICEDESDCKLINAIADFMSEQKQMSVDTAYVPAGGKHGIPKIAEILRGIGVPVKAVFDMDLLSDWQFLKSVIEAFGGDSLAYKSAWNQLEMAIKSIKQRTYKEINMEILDLLKSDIDKNFRSRIKDFYSSGNKWENIKKHGSRTFPRGDAQKILLDLIHDLKKIGVFVIEKGEIENYAPDIGLHGPRFVNKLLAEKNLGDPELRELREFVSDVIQFPKLENGVVAA